MEVKIIIKTPKGCATASQKKLKLILLPLLSKRVMVKEAYVNEEDSRVIWVVEGHLREILKINRNLSRFDQVIKLMFSNKIMRKVTEYKVPKEQLKELKEMLDNQTTVEIIKEATAQEIVEGNMTRWEKIKTTFRLLPIKDIKTNGNDRKNNPSRHKDKPVK